MNNNFNNQVLQEVRNQLDGCMKVHLEGSYIVSDDDIRIRIVESGNTPKAAAKSIVASLKKNRKKDLSSKRFFHI